MSNLLVVDFDYFFYNPLYATDGHDERFWLFDWGHSENLAHQMLWGVRGAEFLRLGFELPGVEIPENWWDRFTFADDAICEVSDSNMYSGIAGGAREFDHVWLFDAHHDLYTIKTQEQLDDWTTKGQICCEDWMFAHHLRGAKLHWRWPQWFTYGRQMRHEIPRWVGCDARKDDLGRFDAHMVFDVVSICRSGAWVPPWCDEAFQAFYTSCPVSEIVQVDEVDLKRAWDLDEMARYAEMTSQAISRASESP